MFKVKTTLNYVIILTAFLGLVIGCGASAEKQALTDFLAMYESTVNEYTAADNSKRAELKQKIDSLVAKWGDMKIEMGAEVTPQNLEKLNIQFREITKKFKSLTIK
ncbi:MAG: hypothetical protein HKO79_07735, partial [Desulfobacterales bacterium]|nr:hypothetical protein [Deltaproteobacteria bacterium]NNL42372.1 hypothetical protein [Desulfobacterales bacterium]